MHRSPRHRPTPIRQNRHAINRPRCRIREIHEPVLPHLQAVQAQRVVGAVGARHGLHFGEIQRRGHLARERVEAKRHAQLRIADQHGCGARDGGDAVEARGGGQVGDLARRDGRRESGCCCCCCCAGAGPAVDESADGGVGAALQGDFPHGPGAEHAVGRVAAEAEVAGDNGEGVWAGGDFGDAVGAVDAAGHGEEGAEGGAGGGRVLEEEDVGLGHGHGDEEVAVGARDDVFKEGEVVAWGELEDGFGGEGQGGIVAAGLGVGGDGEEEEEEEGGEGASGRTQCRHGESRKVGSEKILEKRECNQSSGME